MEHGTGWKQRDRSSKSAVDEVTDQSTSTEASGALVPVTPAEPGADAQLVGRDDLISALENSESSKFTKFLTALSSPRYQTWNVGTLARKFGITPNELATIWRNHNLMKATMTIIEGLPRTAAAIVEDAQSVFQACPRCQGFKYVEVPLGLQEIVGHKYTSCSSCSGTGTVRRPGSDTDRNRMWQAAGWNGRATEVQVNVNQANYTAISVIEELERTGL